MKVFKIVISCLLSVIIIGLSVIMTIYVTRGNLKNTALPENFKDELKKDTFDNNADVRIMSSNLLVHYKSWGGMPAGPRAKKYIEVIKSYRPDVIGLQELSGEWFCALNRNMPEGYKMLFPVFTGAFVRLTGLIYNEKTLELVESGSFAYEEKDNSRLRRVVWGVFKNRKNDKTFAVTSTHLSLLFEGREEEFRPVMRSQAKELSEFIKQLHVTYSCPVIAVGDYNTRETGPDAEVMDFPEIYNYFADRFTDAKYSADNKISGSYQKYDVPVWDHIFLLGSAKAQTFCILSGEYLNDMSDHFPIFADILL